MHALDYQSTNGAFVQVLSRRRMGYNMKTKSITTLLAFQIIQQSLQW